MASMIVRTFGLAHQSSTLTYADQDYISAWARADVETALAYGILTGYHEGILQPQAQATRAEVVTVFMRVLNEKE